MRKRPTLDQWANKYGVSMETVNAYMQARRRWMNRVTAYARKTGGIVSKEVPDDIRQIKPMYGTDFEGYLQYRASVISSRASKAFEYLDMRQDTYLNNLLVRMAESQQLEGDMTVEKFEQFLATASREQKAQLIKELGGASPAVLGYVVEPVSGGSGRKSKYRINYDYDFAPVIAALQNMGVL